MIEQAQAGGYAFSPQQVNKSVTVDDPLAGVGAGLSNLLGKYSKTKQGNEADFLEAMVDHTAGTIKEQSWLTPDAYKQGLAYSQFIDKQSKLSAALPDVSRKVLDADGDLDMFKAELKPILSDLANSLESSGLSGDALVAAQKQNITFVATAMDNFQKQRELKVTQAINTSSYQVTNGSVNMWLASGAEPETFTGFMGSALQQLAAINSASTDPIGTASNFVTDTVKALAKRANPATPEGQRAIQAISLFANSKEAQSMSPKAYNDIQEVLSTKQQDVMSYNSNVLEQQLVEVERAFDAGEVQLSSQDFSNKYKEFQVAVANGTIDESQGMALINKLHTFEKRALKDSQDSWTALNGTQAQRQAMFGTDADSKATDAIVKQAARQFGENYDGAAKFIIQTGIRTQNSRAVTAGFKQYVPQMEVLLGMKPEDIATKADGTHVEAYRGFVNQIQSLQRGSPYMLNKALESIDDKDTRDAIEAYFSTGAKVGANVVFDMKEIQRYKEQIITTRNNGGVNGAAGKGGGFTADDLKSGFFASHAWGFTADPNTGKPSSWLSNPSDDILEKRAQDLNKAWDAARPELAVMEASGQVLITPSQKIRALKELGRVVPIDTGFVTANKGWRSSLRVGNTGVAVNDEVAQRSLEVIRDRFYDKFNGYGGRKFKREDVQMTVIGNELLLSATDDSGQRMTPLQRYGTSVVNETAWQVVEQRKKGGGSLPIGTVRAAGNRKFTVTKDWSAAFGDELAQAMASSFVRYEGNISDARATDPSRPNVVTTSIGIRVDGTHPEWTQRLLEAKKNGTEDQVVGSFVKDYFKNYNQYLKAANLPEPKNLSMTGLQSAYIGMAHAMWQGGQQGGGNAYANMLKLAQSDPAKAAEAFYKSALFRDIDSTSKGKGKDHPRTKMYLQGIADVAAVYNARAVAGLKSGKFQDAFTKGTYPTMASGIAGFKSDVKPYKPTGKDINTYAKEAITKPSYPLQVSGPEGFN